MDEQTQQENIYNTIAKEFGFEDLSDPKQQDLVEKMTESVIKRVLVDSYAKLSDSARQEFDSMMENIDTVDPEQIEVFLRANLTDYDAIIAEAVSDLKKHIAESTV